VSKREARKSLLIKATQNVSAPSAPLPTRGASSEHVGAPPSLSSSLSSPPSSGSSGTPSSSSASSSAQSGLLESLLRGKSLWYRIVASSVFVFSKEAMLSNDVQKQSDSVLHELDVAQTDFCFRLATDADVAFVAEVRVCVCAVAWLPWRLGVGGSAGDVCG
jgi:hypothetical protein